jgi:hypothetical protein
VTDIHLGLLMHRSTSQENPFGPLTPFVERVAHMGNRDGVQVSAFAPEDVDLGRNLVRCTRPAGRSWIHLERPLPAVLWNRYFRRDEEPLIAVLRQAGVRMLNESRLDKWETYQWIQDDPILGACLPETSLLRDAETAFAMAERHPVLFLKPVGGSVGKGIVRVLPGGIGLLRFQYASSRSGSLRETYVSRPRLDRWLQERKDRYIAQQGISLAQVDGRPADIRALVQKDGEGRWQLTGMAARTAARGRFTSNLHTGGTGVEVELLAASLFPGESARQRALLRELEELAYRAVRLIEAGSGALGEVGLDFGVDREGKIWFIEQNIQPGRSIFQQIGRMDLFELAHRRPVQYARYLAEQARLKTGGRVDITARPAYAVVGNPCGRLPAATP